VMGWASKTCLAVSFFYPLSRRQQMATRVART
jgi:hypothetical protein